MKGMNKGHPWVHMPKITSRTTYCWRTLRPQGFGCSIFFCQSTHHSFKALYNKYGRNTTCGGRIVMSKVVCADMTHNPSQLWKSNIMCHFLNYCRVKSWLGWCCASTLSCENNLPISTVVLPTNSHTMTGPKLHTQHSSKKNWMVPIYIHKIQL